MKAVIYEQRGVISPTKAAQLARGKINMNEELTAREAISILIDLKYEAKGHFCGDAEYDETFEKDIAALDMAIAAIETLEG